ncbi:MAG TPA: hypothetical protein VHG72_15190 [Polyangia bacterium]|nr:hypothetical protein [Polyangia bacterium]
MDAKGLNVSAILAAVYRVPEGRSDEIANRVRARVATLETIAECVRLLVDVPAFVVAEMAAAHQKKG